MSRAWMPFYVGDFLADTMHLGATETGIYLRLIMHCWQHGTIPLDDRKLAIISHCDTRLWHQYCQTVLQFFDVVDASTAHHKRVSTELRRYQELSNINKEAYRRRVQNSEAIQTSFSGTQSQSPSPSKKESPSDSCAAPAARAPTKIALQERFQEFRNAYPNRKGSQGWPVAQKKFEAAVKHGETPQAIIDGARAYGCAEAESVGTPFIKTAAAWMHQQGWKEYAAAQPTELSLRVQRETEEYRARRAQERKQSNGADNGQELLRPGTAVHEISGSSKFPGD